MNWHTLGPGDLALSEWQAAGLKLPDLAQIRHYRLEQVRQHLRKFDYAGIVLFDPINIRYATDSTNMQIWIMHNAARYAFVPTEGPVVLFDDPDCKYSSATAILLMRCGQQRVGIILVQVTGIRNWRGNGQLKSLIW